MNRLAVIVAAASVLACTVMVPHRPPAPPPVIELRQVPALEAERSRCACPEAGR